MEKDGKGIRICRKNKEGTRRGRSSIKKSTGEDEITSEQGKKREGRIEDR